MSKIFISGKRCAILIIFLMLSGCQGYQIRMIDTQKEDDLNRSVNLLTRGQKGVIEKTNKIEEDLQSRGEEIESLQKHQSETDTKIDQATVDINIIQGRLEKDGHLLHEINQQIEDLIKDLESEKNEVRSQLTEEGRIISEIVGKLETLKEGKSPAIDEISKRIDSEFNSLKIQSDELKNNMGKLSELIEMLGSKLTSRMDEQGKLIKNIIKRIDHLEKNKGGE